MLAGLIAAVGSAIIGATAADIVSCVKETIIPCLKEKVTGIWRDLFSPSSPRSHFPDLPIIPVGLDDRVEELKRRLFKDNVSKVGVSAMGGSGKTTLAAALCNDPQVIEHFGDKIIFETVSQYSNNMEILESMWEKITGDQEEPNFQSIVDAHRQLQQWLFNRKPHNWFGMKKPQNILVVLDDVWPEVNLQDLLFEAEGYKTVVMARHTVKCVDETYELPLLGEQDALSLFRIWAFGEHAVPDREYSETLIKRVAAECQGLPLALKVIGRSLFEQPPKCWEHALSQLPQGEPIDKTHENALLKRMAMSTEPLDDDTKQCFLDLVLFPEKKKISVSALFDIWRHIHNKKSIHPYKILLELESRKLLNLVNDLPGDHQRTYYGSTSEPYVVQHDVLRSLASYLAAKKKPKRLIVSQNSWEETPEENINAAEMISIHTGSMNEKQWPDVEFPNARALVLIFAGNEYFLPTFLQRMLKLKVLIIINQNSVSTKLEGMSAFDSLAQLRSLRLEKLTVPPLGNYSQALKNLKKLSLSLCKGDKEGLDIEVCSKLLGLVEISIDHCVGIKKLPDSLCNLTYLESLTITNCHDLHKLPDNLGELAGSLKMLMLGACPALKALPASICDLKKLEFLDISQCQCIDTLPDEFGKLQKLEFLDMRECKKIKTLPSSATQLTSLKTLICDEQLKTQWSRVKQCIRGLKLEIAEVKHGLEWLET